MFEIGLGSTVRLENGSFATVIEVINDNRFKVMLRNERIKEVTSIDVEEVYEFNQEFMSY